MYAMGLNSLRTPIKPASYTLGFRSMKPISNLRPLCTLRAQEHEDLDRWIASPPTQTLTDGLSTEHLSDLFITLPTRDGTRVSYKMPKVGTPLPGGHHLAFFHARKAEQHLRADGTDEEISPPPPFTKRMWAGGRMTWNANNPLLVGRNATGTARVAKVEKKGFEQGRPMIFVTQRIEFSQVGQSIASIIEERDHVYFYQGATSNRNRKNVFDREVKNIPTSVDFALRYIPSPVTLFRYSALTFNAHRIHLDKEYCEKVEGYPGMFI